MDLIFCPKLFATEKMKKNKQVCERLHSNDDNILNNGKRVKSRGEREQRDNER
jgi:hypothetical protein